MARTQSEKYPEIREGIMKTAAHLFARQGFASTTIMDLSSACKSSRGALYHYFESKEDILFHLLKEHIDFLEASLQKATDSADAPEEKLRALVRAFMEINAGSRSEQVVLLNDLSQLADTQQQSIIGSQNGLVKIVESAIAEALRSHKVDTKNVMVLTMNLLGSLNYTYTWYDAKGRVSPKEYADICLDVFLNGLLPRR